MASGARITCFTGTKVQILTHPIRSGFEAIVDVDSWHPGRVIALGGGGSKVLSLLALLVQKYKKMTPAEYKQLLELDLPTNHWEMTGSVYLLYWYKSTNTDTYSPSAA